MHSHFSKIGILALSLVVCLAMLGVGYALWDKDVFVYGTVKTGEVNMKIQSISSDDPPGTLDPWHGDIIGEPDPGHEKKDVATTTAWIDEVDDQIGHVLIEDGYPCYWVAVHFTAFNNGTVPTNFAGIGSEGAPACILVDPGNSVGEQVDPGGKKNFTFYVHVGQDCEENNITDYKFTVTALFEQWNE